MHERGRDTPQQHTLQRAVAARTDHHQVDGHARLVGELLAGAALQQPGRRLQPLGDAVHGMFQLGLRSFEADRSSTISGGSTAIVGVPVSGGTTIATRSRPPAAAAIWAPRWRAVHASGRPSNPTHTMLRRTGPRSERAAFAEDLRAVAQVLGLA